MYVEPGSKVKISFGKYKGKEGTYSRYSCMSELHIVVVENLVIPEQTVEIALRNGEFEVAA